MRTFFICLAFLLMIAAGYLFYAQLSGGAVPTFGLPVGGERALVRQQIQRFFEHVKFKNKSALSTMVPENTTMEDIESFLSKVLGQEPSELDLQSVKIDSVELDSSGTRARCLVSLSGQNLAEQKPFTVNRMLFLYKEGPDNWLLDIKNINL